jgi:hypothetical protein
MNTAVALTVTALVAALTACSEPAPGPAEAPIPTAAITPENQGVLTDTQREGLNGASEVSDVLKQADEERRKQMEAQGR